LRRQLSLGLPFLLRGGWTVVALAAYAASTLDSQLCVAGFHQLCPYEDKVIISDSIYHFNRKFVFFLDSGIF
jgi:hypothetical protein